MDETRAVWTRRTSHAIAASFVGFDRDDLVQEAALAAMRAEPLFDGRGTMEGFLFSRMRFGMLEWMRTETVRARHDLRDPFELASQVAASAQRIGDADVRRAVRWLQPRERQVVFMSFWLDMSDEQIAAALCVFRSRVWKIRTRALKKLEFLLS